MAFNILWSGIRSGWLNFTLEFLALSLSGSVAMETLISNSWRGRNFARYSGEPSGACVEEMIDSFLNCSTGKDQENNIWLLLLLRVRARTHTYCFGGGAEQPTDQFLGCKPQRSTGGE